MASLTITIPDLYVPRIQEAFGRNGQLATLAELQKAIKGYVRARVIQYESAKASSIKHNVISKEAW